MEGLGGGGFLLFIYEKVGVTGHRRSADFPLGCADLGFYFILTKDPFLETFFSLQGSLPLLTLHRLKMLLNQFGS